MKSTARAVLEMGRVSNLPTVWTNCLAAWLLTGGSPYAPVFAVVCVAASLIYVGGTVLNDAFDVPFDRDHRPDRPIPSGRITRKATAVLGGTALVLGVFFFLVATTAHPALVLALSGAVLVYDWIHKRAFVGPWVMGLCRLLLYAVAADAAPGADLRNALLVGAGASLYVVGLSYVARGEATGARLLRWPLVLLAAPALLALWAALIRSSGMPATGILPFAVLFVFCGWTGMALAVLKDKSNDGRVGKAVSMLLAGLVLIDALMLSFFFPLLMPVLLAVLLLTLGLQRLVPAT